MGRPKGSKKVLSEIDLQIKQLQDKKKAERKKASELKQLEKQKKAKDKADKDSFTEKLIAEVKKHGCIWDKSLDTYRNKNMKDQAYSYIGELLDRTGTEIYDSWKNLVDMMRRQCENEGRSGDGLDDIQRPPTWKFYNSMTFVKDANFRFRESQSNFDLADDDSSSNVDESLNIGNQSPDMRNDERYETQENENDQMDNSPPHSPRASSSRQIPDPPSNPPSPLVYKNKQASKRAKKRSSTSEVKADLDTHIGMLTKFLSEPNVTAHERFLSYLDDILSKIPPIKIRKCEQDILTIANAYADGDEQNIKMVIEYAM